MRAQQELANLTGLSSLPNELLALVCEFTFLDLDSVQHQLTSHCLIAVSRTFCQLESPVVKVLVTGVDRAVAIHIAKQAGREVPLSMKNWLEGTDPTRGEKLAELV